MLGFKKGQLLRILIILFLVVFAGTYLLPWALTMQAGDTTTSFSIAFEGSGKGLDPQGNRFDINEIKNAEVLNAAIEKAGMTEKTNAEELANRLYVLPQAGQDTLKQLLTLGTIDGKTQDIKEQIVYPTTFVVGLRDIGLPSYISDRKLLKEIMIAYKAYLQSRYLADTDAEPAYTEEEILDLDYPEMMNVLVQQTEMIERYINVYAEEEPQFVSAKTGLSFADLSEKAGVLKETDINNMKSLVSYYRLTKDPDGRVQYEQTLLRRALVIATKLQGAQVTTNDIIQIYDNNSNYLFAAGDGSSINFAPVENQFYSDLIAALVEKQTDYIDAKYTQLDITRAIEKMQAGMLDGTQYERVTKSILAGTKDIMEQMNTLREAAREMAKEYYKSDIGSKIEVGGISYHPEAYGGFLFNYFALLAILLLGRLIILHLYDSEYGVYLERLRQFMGEGRKQKQYAQKRADKRKNNDNEE